MDENLKALHLYRLMKNALQTEGIDELRVTMTEDGQLEVWVVPDVDRQ